MDFRFQNKLRITFIIVVLQLAYSSYKTVHISSVNLHTEGIYRCEVSNEFPVFDTVSRSVRLKVVGE